MRRFLKVVIVVSGLALLVTLAASIALASRMRDGARSPDARQGGQALFHILAVVPASDAERYYARAVEAMTRTARKRGAVLQTLEYDQDNAPSAIARQLRLAAELEPDGVVVSAPLDPLVTEAVDTLSKRGVPVVALETDLPGSARAAFIGTNPYSVGVLAAEAVAE
ncbi:MAG TPA: substrate-binding domain-containing protein, partial [Spirochaetales bacterium]|nr:substrate-binding domain-containing protein [Spirochaetales bacterium]